MSRSKNNMGVGCEAGLGIASVNCLVQVLKPGWDSYSGKVVNPKAQARAISIIESVVRGPVRAPQVAPCSNGGLQLEWHNPPVQVEIYIYPSGNAELWAEDDKGRSFDGRYSHKEAIKWLRFFCNQLTPAERSQKITGVGHEEES